MYVRDPDAGATLALDVAVADPQGGRAPAMELGDACAAASRAKEAKYVTLLFHSPCVCCLALCIETFWGLGPWVLAGAQAPKP